MKVFRARHSAPVRAPDAIFEGAVYRETVVDESEAELLRLARIAFEPGARTRLHTHSFDQVLVIVEGSGILATEQQENGVEAGDVVLVPAGERHWHGATASTSMAHLSVTTPGTTDLV